MILLGDGEIIPILETLEQVSSTNEKIDIIKRYKNNLHLRAYFDIALNPYRVYHIKKLPTKSITGLNQATIKDIYSLGGLAKYLESKRGLKGEDLDIIYYYFKDLNSELSVKWAEKAILKKAIAGIGVKTVNKAFGEKFIPEHNIMLMSRREESFEALTYPVYVQRKLDGFRLTYIPDIGFVGRSGKPISNINLSIHFNIGSVISVNKNVLNSLDSVFDGEVYSHERDFNDIASILSSINKPIPEDIEFHVFNIIPIEAWNKRVMTGSYTDQLQLFKMLEPTVVGQRLKFIQTFTAYNIKDLQKLYQSFLSEGYEGAIVRAVDFVYDWKRCTLKSQTIMKLKPKDCIDAKIVGVFEGQGAMVGMLGGFHIELENGIQLKVGSGFKERERMSFWKIKNELIGEWVTLDYTERTPDNSLRFPVFHMLRDSKG